MSRELDVFSLWTKTINETYGMKKYLSDERDDILSSLAESLKEWEVELDNALLLKRKVKDFLVTNEGKKGKNNHKGWSETVEGDFTAIVMGVYKEEKKIETKVQSTPLEPQYGIGKYVPKNAFITAWAEDRFGIAWTEKLNLECHKHNSTLNDDFRREVLDAEWCHTGENPPEWYQKLVA